MHKVRWGVEFLAILAAASLAVAQTGKGPAKAPAAAQPAHKTLLPADLKWAPIIPGADMAVVDGDPNKTGGIFTIRIKSAAGTKILPHYHPTDELVTVLQGSLGVAIGDQFDEKALTPLPVGGFISIPKQMHHYAFSKVASILQVHGEGPFKVIFVNPADDPANKAGAAKKK